MSESQSRYSIVERLTRTKLDLMGAKSDVDESLRKQEELIEREKKELEHWTVDVENQVKKERRDKHLSIVREQDALAYLKDRVVARRAVYDDKISTIDVALKSIEDISRTAPSPSS